MTKFVSVNATADDNVELSVAGDFAGRHLFVMPQVDVVQDAVRELIATRVSGSRDTGQTATQSMPSGALAAPAVELQSVPEIAVAAPVGEQEVRHIGDPRGWAPAPLPRDKGDGKGFDGYDRHDGTKVVGDGTTHDEGVVAITVGGFVSGVIDTTGDTDTITVSLVAGQTYSFSLFGSGATPVSDTFLEVFAPGGALVQEDDDGGVGVYSQITFTATTTGTYNIIASSFNNPGDPGTGGYTLHVAQAGADSVGSTIATAGSAALGYTYGFIETSGDQDLYQVTLTAGLVYNFEVAGGADYNTDYLAVPTGELDTILTVYNSLGQVVFTNDDIDFPDDISSAGGFVPDADGSYYVQVRAYTPQTGGYVLNITSLDPSTLDPLDAIDWGGPANVVDNSDTLLIYFATAGQTYDGVTDLGGWTPYLQQQALEAFQTYSQFSDLTFAITTNSAIADFHLVTTTSTEYLAYFNPPGETNAGVGVFATNGTGWDSTGAAGSMEPGGYGWITFIHEFGHGLGMAHPHDNGGGSEVLPGVSGPFGSYGIFDLNQGVYTTMSYNDGWQLNPAAVGGVPSPDTLDYGYQAGPMALDIALMQLKYGAVAHHIGGDTYTLTDANVAGTFYSTIWDTGGTDTINYVGARNVHIDLIAATLDYSATGGGVVSYAEGIFGGFTIANGVVIENATGDAGNDVLIGNSAANVLTGNGGNDTLMGRGGNDTLIGNAGTNTAIFSGNEADYTITAIMGGFTVQDNNLADGDDGTDTLTGITYAQFADGTRNLLDAPGNQAPTLTGLTTSLNFNENVVNGAPQLIDTDVTFTDTDDNFTGGTLVVSGLLGEDVVAVRNQGSGAGQVGVSGANLTYGGVVIGTIAGGSGATLTVTFNNFATSIAVEAVIENLTYANASNTPTADRTLTLNVTDDAGASLAASVYTPGPFVEATGAADPLANPGILPTFDASPMLSFVDVNNDGDIDIVVGTVAGNLRYFERSGASYTEVTGAANPFNGYDPTIPAGETAGSGAYSSPATMDIDGDGDLDLVIGSNYGLFDTFRNNGNGTWTQLIGAANPLNGISDPNFSDPTAIDYDGDGDMDIVAGSSYGDLYAIRNNGNGTFTLLSGAGRPFTGVDVGSFSSTTSGDLDGDGDLDLVVGTAAGTLITFFNNGGGSFTQAVGAANPFNGIDVGSYSLPVLTDIDGDGDADLVVGDGAGGDTRVFINTSTTTAGAAPAIAVHINAQNDAPSGANATLSTNENTNYVFTLADFGFSDVDGNAFNAVSFTTFPAQGGIFYDPDGPGGAAAINIAGVGPGVFIAASDIAAGRLYFVPDANESGNGYANFTFKVQDNGGIANGGVDLDPTANTITFNVLGDNTAPTLTGFGPSATFTAPVAAQLIDSSVVFSDAEGNFNGGTLVVSGLLAEDTVGVRNQGSGAGQIGVSGANVSYSGVVIGTIAGGVGATLTVTLNAAATTAAVDALIENLTYSNPTGATADRTLTLNVTDDGGLSIVSPPAFEFMTPSAFDGLNVTVGANTNGSYPTFLDVDGDGDMDMLAGSQNGTILYFQNNAGTFTSAASPITLDVGSYSTPTAIDIDNDGDMDIVSSGNTGVIFTFRNDGGGTFTQLTGAANPFNGVDIGSFGAAGATDIDGDGLTDLVVGIGGAGAADNGALAVFHHNANGTFTQLTGAANPFNGIDVGSYSNPSFFDFDGDGDEDALIGNLAGNVLAYVNNGGVFTAAPAFNDFVGDGLIGSTPALAFVDLDGDGDLDAVSGSYYGDFLVFENTQTVGVQIDVHVDPSATPNLEPSGANSEQTIARGVGHIITAAEFGFTDTDGDAFAAVVISSVPGAGSRLLYQATPGGAFVAVTVGQVISIADINAGKLSFRLQPGGVGPGSFGFQVQDDGGTAGGGVDTDQTPNTMTFNPPNLAPSGADSTQTLVRGTPHIITAAEFGFTDPDGDTLASITISSVPGAGSRLLYQATPGGAFVAVTVGQVISIADINAGKLSFRLQPGGVGPGSFGFQVTDSGDTVAGGMNTDATPNTLTFKPPNSAPAGTDATIVSALGVPHIMTASDFGFSDTDGDAFSSVTISSVPGFGARLLYQATPGGAFVAVTVGQVISIADINAGKLSFRLQPGGTGMGDFGFQVHDNGGTVLGGVDTDQSPNTLSFVSTPPPGGAAVEGAHTDALSSGVGGVDFLAVGGDAHTTGLRLDVDHADGSQFLLGSGAAIDTWTVDVGATIDHLSGHDLFAGPGGGQDLALAVNPEQLLQFSQLHTTTDFAFA